MHELEQFVTTAALLVFEQSLVRLQDLHLRLEPCSLVDGRVAFLNNHVARSRRDLITERADLLFEFSTGKAITHLRPPPDLEAYQSES